MKYLNQANTRWQHENKSGSIESEFYIRWITEGKPVEPADPEPAPVDQSDLDQLQKQMKAVLLCVAQVGGLTAPQMKTMFKNKMDAMP